MIITNSSPDEFYYNQLLAFLSSVETNTDNTVNVFLANYPEDKVKVLKRKFSKHKFDNRNLKSLDKRGFSFIQFRADLILECFKKYNEPVAWIDTDVIVRGDINDFLKIEPTQLKILYRGKQAPEKVKINAGIFNIGYSKETFDFISDWRKRIETNAKWGMGQLELWRTYKQHKDKVILCPMSDKYNDLGGADRPNAFSDDSVMWHCKKAHFNNPKFQKEFKYYLDLGKGV